MNDSEVKAKIKELITKNLRPLTLRGIVKGLVKQAEPVMAEKLRVILKTGSLHPQLVKLVALKKAKKQPKKKTFGQRFRGAFGG